MSAYTTDLDLAALRLASGEGRRIELAVVIEPVELAGERYVPAPKPITVKLEVSRMVGHGYAIRLSFQAHLEGPCMRCLTPASPTFAVDAREIAQPGGIEELDSPYLEGGVLDVRGWARDALALMLPAQILCRPDCAGLCPVCGADLNAAGAEHGHEAAPDPRWSKLSEIRFD